MVEVGTSAQSFSSSPQCRQSGDQKLGSLGQGVGGMETGQGLPAVNGCSRGPWDSCRIVTWVPGLPASFMNQNGLSDAAGEVPAKKEGLIAGYSIKNGLGYNYPLASLAWTAVSLCQKGQNNAKSMVPCLSPCM